MDTIDAALADGEALLRQLERNEGERENRRRNFVTVNVPIGKDADGIARVQTMSVPRGAVSEG